MRSWTVMRAMAPLSIGAVLLVSGAGVSSSASAATRSSSDQVVKVGVYSTTASTNSVGEDFGGIFGGSEAAARAINKVGIPHHPGLKLQVVACNTHENPNDIAACASTFASDGVVAVDGSISTVATPTTNLAADGIPNVAINPLNAADFASTSSYPLGATSTLGNAAAGIGLVKAGAKKVWVLTASTPAAAIIPKFVQLGVQSVGGTFVGSYGVPLTGVTDFTPAVTAAEQAGAQGVVFVVPESYAVSFMKTAKELGQHFTYGVSQNYGSPQQDALVSKLAANHEVEYGAFPPVSLTSQFPTLKTFQSNMQAEYKSGDKNAAPSEVTSFAVQSWVGMHVIADIIAASSSPTITASTINTALNGGQSLSLHGLGPNWDPTNKVTALLPRISWPYIYLATVNKDGKPTLIGKKAVNLSNINFNSAA